ncbi:MAG: DUF3987 domain-containing protein [Gammaproteobacteria bacterium]|nr:DUF3987 domain-containing protein [Gammaproteobacteria bacterium]
MNETPQQAARRLAATAIRDGYQPEALHAYTDVNGNPLHWRIRAKHPDTGDKWIRPMKLNGGDFDLAEPKYPNGKPLYALHYIARDPDAIVWIVEGEQKADALNKLGLVTTTSGGATGADKADWEPLRGRNVVIWPDNDDPGKSYAGEVTDILLSLGCRIECLDVDRLGLGKGEDVMEWLAVHPGAVKDDIEALPKLTTHADQKETWPVPMPLPDALPPVKAFDFDLLPDSLRLWIQDIAERVQCPPDFPAVGAMISLSAVVGRKIGIRPKRRDDWLEVPNLWGAIIGRPGVMKSPALRESMRPLRKLEVAALENFDVEVSEWRRANELFKLKREAERSNIVKALKKGKAVGSDALADEFTDDEPQARRYVVNDCSVEALGEILRFNPNGTLAYRDELVGLLKSLDREGNEGARGFFLSAWSGTEGYTFDRIGRGLNLRIDACCLSLLGSIQPAVIGTYLRQAVAGAGGDGLLSRFQLLVWPDIAGEWRDVDRWPDTEAKATAHQTFERLDTFDPMAIGATVEDGVIPYLRFDEAAQELFSEWRAGFEHRIRSGNDHAAFESHLAKYRKLVPALALLIHLADHAGGAIGETALLKALAWAEYLESHAQRAYASVIQAEAESARALLARIRRGEVPDPFGPRDVYLKHWAFLSNPEETRQAVRLLGELDYLREERQETGGRPKALYWINPKARAA